MWGERKILNCLFSDLTGKVSPGRPLFAERMFAQKGALLQS